MNGTNLDLGRRSGEPRGESGGRANRWVIAWRRRAVAALLAIAGLAGVTRPAGAAEWIKLEAPDFVVLSDAGEKVVREFALEFAGFREATRQMFAPEGMPVPRSILILHARHRDFVAYGVREGRDERTRPFSLSMELDGQAVTALARGANWMETRRTLQEFETMWVLRRYGWSLPTWMSQGAGSVWSTTLVDDDQEVVVGTLHPHAGVWMEGSMLPWTRFFEVGRGSPEYRGEKQPGVFHAQAWGLMHWLLLRDDGGRERFVELARRVNREPFAAAAAAVGGVELERFDREIHAHVRGRLPRRRFAFEAKAVEAAFTVAPLAEAELLALQADVAAAAGNGAEADLRYLRAVALAPTAPATLEAGARWYARRGEMAAAIEKYRAAMAAGSTNPAAYLASAEWRLNRSGGPVDRIGSGVPLVMAEAEAEVRRALELDPGPGEAYRLLGRLAILEAEPDPSKLELLGRGIGADFWGTQARYYRALLLQRLDRGDEARADLEWIVAQAETGESTRNQAERQLADLRLAPLRRAVMEAVEARRFEAAQDLLETWARETAQPGDGGVVRQLQELIADHQKADEQQQLNREMDRLNRLIKARRFDAAQAAARELAQREVSATLREAFQRVAAQVDEIATLQLMRAAIAGERWAEAVALGEAYLPGAPAESKHRSAIEAALTEARSKR